MLLYIVGGLIMALLLGVYIISFVYNEKTPVPESLKDRYDEAQTCGACGSISESKFEVPIEVLKQFKEDNQ